MPPNAPIIPALVLLCLAFGSIPGAAYLEDGFVQANSSTESGSTASAAQPLNLSRVFVGGAFVGTASGSTSGPMNGVMNMASSASINSTLNQGASNGSAEFRITDTLTVTAPGYAVGTTVLAKLSVTLNGTLSSGGSGDVTAQAIAQVEGPLKSWIQETGNSGGPFTSDPDGMVIFAIPLKIGQPENDNLDLGVNVASATTRNPEADPEDSYAANASASLQVDLGSIIDITTTCGEKVYGWTISAESSLNYGAGDPLPPPPGTPQLKIRKSLVDQGTLVVCWHADPAQPLIVQGSTNGATWFKETAIDTQFGEIVLPPGSRPGSKLFRITRTTPAGGLSTPGLHISPGPSSGKVTLRWDVQASESYRLYSAPLADPLVWEEIYSVSAASGPISFTTNRVGPQRVYRVLNSFTSL